MSEDKDSGGFDAFTDLVSGHSGFLSTPDRLGIVKLTTPIEVGFYRHFDLSSPLAEFIPKCYGTSMVARNAARQIEGSDTTGRLRSDINAAVCLENVTTPYKHPNVFEFKLGCTQYAPGADVRKRLSKLKKALRSTSASLGVRMHGFRMHHDPSSLSEPACPTVTVKPKDVACATFAQLCASLQAYFSLNADAAVSSALDAASVPTTLPPLTGRARERAVRVRSELRRLLLAVGLERRYRFVTSSLLIVEEGVEAGGGDGDAAATTLSSPSSPQGHSAVQSTVAVDCARAAGAEASLPSSPVTPPPRISFIDFSRTAILSDTDVVPRVLAECSPAVRESDLWGGDIWTAADAYQGCKGIGAGALRVWGGDEWLVSEEGMVFGIGGSDCEGREGGHTPCVKGVTAGVCAADPNTEAARAKLGGGEGRARRAHSEGSNSSVGGGGRRRLRLLEGDRAAAEQRAAQQLRRAFSATGHGKGGEGVMGTPLHPQERIEGASDVTVGGRRSRSAPLRDPRRWRFGSLTPTATPTALPTAFSIDVELFAALRNLVCVLNAVVDGGYVGGEMGEMEELKTYDGLTLYWTAERQRLYSEYMQTLSKTVVPKMAVVVEDPPVVV